MCFTQICCCSVRKASVVSAQRVHSGRQSCLNRHINECFGRIFCGKRIVRQQCKIKIPNERVFAHRRSCESKKEISDCVGCLRQEFGIHARIFITFQIVAITIRLTETIVFPRVNMHIHQSLVLPRSELAWICIELLYVLCACVGDAIQIRYLIVNKTCGFQCQKKRLFYFSVQL